MSSARILVVCTGNVCRSPFLERRLQNSLDSIWGQNGMSVASAGTGALVAAPIDPLSASLLERLGVASSDFVARQLTTSMVADSQLVLTATRAHRGLVARLHPRSMRYTFAVADFADLVDHIPDDQMPTVTEPGEWLGQIASLAAQRRGLHPPMAADEADIVDPYRRGPEVFQAMAAQIERWMPSLRRALGQAGGADPQRRREDPALAD
ncbi:protein tyrosine phosphatase [Knoellia sinensis KCTC 19936]|uniref:Protein tyrosine phosphatase n=1 Tax=Knoellia sinensis KCTC 19936 TaxID=1385520 RepID=A0A0A0JCR9_9MICO|nr:hypothetical protein [Knoellia sinensis]KGN34564.1 protein tyrosine phosphatase [Knoellia sinensis KCTC 19936]